MRHSLTVLVKYIKQIKWTLNAGELMFFSWEDRYAYLRNYFEFLSK